MYHGLPNVGQTPTGRGRRSRTRSSSRSKKPTKRKRLTTAERKKRAVNQALKKERGRKGGRQGGKRKRSRSSSSDTAVEFAKTESRALSTPCFSFSKGYGPCAKMKAGSKCKQKVPRAHKCHVCEGAHSAKEKGCKPKKKEG